MIKLSVKKPFTVFVAVIAALLIAVVSLSKLQADLLPEFSTPYLLVITTYPGASPEKVEAEVTEVVESSLSTINHVKTYTSNSAENYSLTMLEFDEDTDMDAALVKVYTGIEEIKDKLPDLAGSPSVMEIREIREKELDTLWEGNKRFTNPSQVYVDLSDKLYDMKSKVLNDLTKVKY